MSNSVCKGLPTPKKTKRQIRIHSIFHYLLLDVLNSLNDKETTGDVYGNTNLISKYIMNQPTVKQNTIHLFDTGRLYKENKQQNITIVVIETELTSENTLYNILKSGVVVDRFINVSLNYSLLERFVSPVFVETITHRMYEKSLAIKGIYVNIESNVVSYPVNSPTTTIVHVDLKNNANVYLPNIIKPKGELYLYFSFDDLLKFGCKFVLCVLCGCIYNEYIKIFIKNIDMKIMKKKNINPENYIIGYIKSLFAKAMNNYSVKPWKEQIQYVMGITDSYIYKTGDILEYEKIVGDKFDYIMNIDIDGLDKLPILTCDIRLRNIFNEPYSMMFNKGMDIITNTNYNKTNNKYTNGISYTLHENNLAIRLDNDRLLNAIYGGSPSITKTGGDGLLYHINPLGVIII